MKSARARNSMLSRPMNAPNNIRCGKSKSDKREFSSHGAHRAMCRVTRPDASPPLQGAEVVIAAIPVISFQHEYKGACSPNEFTQMAAMKRQLSNSGT